ncbi:MAG: RNA polymerase sigma-70 factor [Tannerellaceae bacterium]|jgi:RNA polymerase sigma-70 factor (ECF subfamily)|nr:RNA polymerase sigma-70 factor [Tannerellaceae bacterium]
MNEPLNDHELLGNFRELYKKYAPELIAYAARFVNKGVAEDFVHDVFIKIWNKRTILYWADGIKTYLYHAIRYACIDHLKHEEMKTSVANNAQVKLKIGELYYAESSSRLWQDDIRLQAVYKEIDKLPEKCRQIFIMAYIEECKAAEIACRLNISKRTVEAQLYKALKQIRQTLAANYGPSAGDY